MKLVLADPPDVKTPWLIANHPNMGILYLIGYLRQQFPDLEIHYLEAFLSLEDHLKALATLQPDLYGLSFSSMRLPEAAATLRAVREHFPALPLIVGGACPTIMARDILQDLPVDICVLGEGEVTLTELVEVHQGRRRLPDILGIAYKQDGQIIVTDRRPLIPNLDDIPFPAWDMVDFANYPGNYQFMAQPGTVLIASRGCPYDCVFCASPVWKLSKPWMRLRSPANIAAEIQLLYDRGIREISIRSDEFNPVLSWSLDICRAIQHLGLPGLYFQGNLRADKITDELVREMRRCNFWLVQIGIESGNQRTLDGIAKHITLEQVVESCRLFKKYGIKVYGYFMIYHAWEENGALCYETPADVANTFAFIRRLKKDRLIDYMSFSTATPMPGSRLFGIAQRHHILKQDTAVTDLSDFYMDLPHISPRAMKRSRLQGLLLQTAINLRSGHNCFSDWGKNIHKIKTFFKSLA